MNLKQPTTYKCNESPRLSKLLRTNSPPWGIGNDTGFVAWAAGINQYHDDFTFQSYPQSELMQDLDLDFDKYTQRLKTGLFAANL